MKTVGSSLVVSHLNEPVSIQVLRSVKAWEFLNRRVFLSVMAIQHFEEQGAFDEPATYYIIAHKFGSYQLIKRKNP